MPQALTPEEIEKTEFHITMRGFARDEVREFLLAVAGVVRHLQEKADTSYLNLGEKMGELLQQAKDAADELTAETRAAAQRTQEEVRTAAARTEQDASTRAADIVETAESHATKMIREAEQRVAELRATEETTRRELQAIRTQLDTIASTLRPMEPAVEDAGTTVGLPVEIVSEQTQPRDERPDQAAMKV
jgi:DivIVA domain-containing protein